MAVPKLKWWAWVIIGVVAIGLVSAVAGGGGSDPDFEIGDVEALEARLEDSRVIAEQGTVRSLAARVEPGANPSGLLDDARRMCEGATHCNVMGWTDRNLVTTTMPLTDQEAEGLSFSYSLNRSTGLDRALWDCSAFDGIAPEQCLAK